MVKIQPMFSDDKTVSSVIASEDGDEFVLKNIALDNNSLKHWKFDYYQGSYKQIHHRFVFRSEEERRAFEEKVRESGIHEKKETINRPKIYRHGAK